MTVYGISHCTCRSPPWMVISQIPALTAHISFLLWELIIWQTRSWQNYSHIKWQFHRFLWNSYFIPTLRAEHLADQVQTRSWQNYSHIKWQFHRFLWNSYFHSYSKSSTFGRPGHCRSIPHQMAISQIPALTAHISWQFIFHSYSESLSFGRPGLGISTPHPMVISQIPALTAHYSESSTFGRPGLGRSDPNIRWQFHRFLWNSYFIPTLRAQHLADRVLADLPPIK